MSLTATATTCPGGVTWCRQFTYDQYGNRTLAASVNLPMTPGINGFSATTNRLTTAPVAYDLAGNMTVDTVGQGMTYDAENRLRTFTDPGTPADNRTYGYDGEGRRVMATGPTITTRGTLGVSILSPSSGGGRRDDR